MKYFILFCVVLITSCASGSSPVYTQGKALFETTFNPEQNFAHDLEDSTDDQIILTVVTSKRNDYLPDYSLAIAFRWILSKNGQSTGEYTARMLRVKPTDEPLGVSYSIGNLEWIEA